MRQVREDYRVSIESFAHMVKDYIAQATARLPAELLCR